MEEPTFYDDSPLAAAEVEMVNLLNQEQCEAVAACLKLYGYAFAKESERICECP